MSVEVTVSIPAGDVTVDRQILMTLTDDGTRELPEVLRDACNAVLMSYGLTQRLSVQRPLERLRTQAQPNLVETKRQGW